MSRAVAVRSVESIVVSLPRDEPYLGPLGPGESINAKGYFVRRGNRTVYPSTDMSVLVRITADDGTIGWGETYGVAAPQATVAIIDELLAPFVIGRDPRDAAIIWQELYDLMRVRGASGGYYGDALAGIDIALWDLSAKRAGASLSEYLGGTRAECIPAYASGLPRATLDARVQLASAFVAQGYRGIKYAAVAAHEGIVAEMRALRTSLGDSVDLMVDLHWRHTTDEAIALIGELAAYRPYFVEAPVAPEDVGALAAVAAAVPLPIAAGEEWRNAYEARLRFERGGLAIVQPEMGHTGVSQFLAIADLAQTHRAQVVPHATIGVGIFLAASLHASAVTANLPYHEYQHSVFDKNLRFVKTTMHCAEGFYTLPEGPGLGVEPAPALWEFIRK